MAHDTNGNPAQPNASAGIGTSAPAGSDARASVAGMSAADAAAGQVGAGTGASGSAGEAALMPLAAGSSGMNASTIDAGTSLPAAAGGASGVAGAAAMAPAPAAGARGLLFELSATAASLSAGEVAFPAAALPPMNQSPEFTWTGVPAAAKSLALVFTDVSGGAVKWVVWDIPTTVARLPAAMSDEANPPEVPGSSQIGSLGNQGYAGPCCVNNRYEFVLWALDIEKLPAAQRASTYTLRDLILEHDTAMTAPVKMRIMR